MALLLWLSLLTCFIALPCSQDVNIASEALALGSWITGIQSKLHRIPELKHQEHKTSATLRAALMDMDIPCRFPVAGTGLTADIGRGLPIVALRADMDALAVQEAGDAQKISLHEGVMHACGHDAHMAMLLGAAKLLKRREEQLRGTVRLIFQPAEEGGGGAAAMVRDGVLDGVAAAFGLHVWPGIESGVFSTRAGPIMASSTDVKVVIRGRGGHAAMPHLTSDPIMAVAAAVSALQTIVSRNVSPLDAVVLSITRLEAGDVFNVINDEAEFGGTLRAFRPEDVDLAKRRIVEIVNSIAEAHGCNASVSWRQDVRDTTPATWNDAALADFVSTLAPRLFQGAYQELETPSMAAEDFACYAQRVPACFVFLGIRNETYGSVHNLHSADFRVDPSALPRGAALLAQLALSWIESPVGSGS